MFSLNFDECIIVYILKVFRNATHSFFCIFQKATVIRAKALENLILPYANNKGANQPVNPRRLISVFVVRCLHSIIPLVSVSESSSLYLAYVAAQTGFSLTWSETPKTGFLVMWLNYYKIVYATLCYQDRTISDSYLSYYPGMRSVRGHICKTHN